jgi:hypothetical protein
MKTMTLEQLIEAAEICGSGKESACIESGMTQAAAALKEYACNGGGI